MWTNTHCFDFFSCNLIYIVSICEKLQTSSASPSIYTIMCLKSVCLSVGDVRRLQVAILARSPREMSQTDRILPRYFLSRVRVSVRASIFLYAKNIHKLSRMPSLAHMAVE